MRPHSHEPMKAEEYREEEKEKAEMEEDGKWINSDEINALFPSQSAVCEGTMQQWMAIVVKIAFTITLPRLIPKNDDHFHDHFHKEEYLYD